MVALASIFLDFNLPNAATWFYFSLLLAIALFFKFSRFLSVRNWDVLSLFLLVPGLLLLQEAHQQEKAENAGLETARLIGAGSQALSAPGSGISGAVLATTAAAPLTPPPPRTLWLGYAWLLAGSGYFLFRCFVDLVLVRRPALSPNLNPSGLAWLALTLFVCLVAVAARRPVEPVGKESAPIREIREAAPRAVDQAVAETGANPEIAADSRVWVERTLAILGHVAVLVALILIGYRHFHDAHAGMAAATFYLLLPYTALHVGQLHHVLPMALLLWAVAFYRQPTLAGLFLGLAAGTIFPAATFPVWLSFYRRRGAGRFTAAFVTAAVLGLVATGLVLDLSDWQPWLRQQPTTESFWSGIHWAYRIPVFVGFVAMVAATAFWPAPKNLAHLLALSAAVLIGIQFWYADHGGVYVLWYLPLLLLLVFRPNLSDREALPIQQETDWLARLGRRLARFGGRLQKLPEPPILRVR
ncbi:MAG TPA: glycosyltransferase 87 family protein [Gemmataceae bacterium]|nr:glycosyltransferase 87 family protein [Gemmataceae bacterium]